MDDSLTEKIRAVLADPDAASKIAAIASSLSGGSNGGSAPQQSAPASAPASASAEQPSIPAGAPFSLPSFGKDPRLDLLRALKPLVAEEKRGRLDDLVQIATVASLLGSLNKRGGTGHV